MAERSTWNRNAVVIMIALVAAAYQMLRLEQRRANRDAKVDEEFEDAVRVLRSYLAAEYQAQYQVLVAQRSFSSPDVPVSVRSIDLSALVVNRAKPVPQIEAELFVDAARLVHHRAQTQRPSTGNVDLGIHPSHKRRGQKPVSQSTLKFRMHDSHAMGELAKFLQERGIAHVEPSSDKR